MSQPPTHVWTASQTIDLVEFIHKQAVLAKAFLDPDSIDPIYQKSYQQKLCLQLLQRTEWMDWMRREEWVVLGEKGLRPTEKWGSNNPVKERLAWLQLQHIRLCTRLHNYESAAAMGKDSAERRLWDEYKRRGGYEWYFTYHKLWMANSPAAIRTKDAAPHPLAEAAFKSTSLHGRFCAGAMVGALPRQSIAQAEQKPNQDDDDDVEFVQARPIAIPPPPKMAAPIPRSLSDLMSAASGSLADRIKTSMRIPPGSGSGSQASNRPVAAGSSSSSGSVSSSNSKTAKADALALPTVRKPRASASTGQSLPIVPAKRPRSSTPSTAPASSSARTAASSAPIQPIESNRPGSALPEKSKAGSSVASTSTSSGGAKRVRTWNTVPAEPAPKPKFIPDAKSVIIVIDSDDEEEEEAGDDDYEEGRRGRVTRSKGKAKSKRNPRSRTTSQQARNANTTKSLPSPPLSLPESSSSQPSRSRLPQKVPLPASASSSPAPHRPSGGIPTPPPEVGTTLTDEDKLARIINPRGFARELKLRQQLPARSPVVATAAAEMSSDEDSDSDDEFEPIEDDHYSGIILDQTVPTLGFTLSPDLPEGDETYGPRLSLFDDDGEAGGSGVGYPRGGEREIVAPSRPQTPPLPNLPALTPPGSPGLSGDDIIIGERAEEEEELEEEVEGMRANAPYRPLTPSLPSSFNHKPATPSSQLASRPATPPLPPNTTPSLPLSQSRPRSSGVLIPSNDNISRPSPPRLNVTAKRQVDERPPTPPLPAFALLETEYVIDTTVADEDAFLAALEDVLGMPEEER